MCYRIRRIGYAWFVDVYAGPLMSDAIVESHGPYRSIDQAEQVAEGLGYPDGDKG